MPSRSTLSQPAPADPGAYSALRRGGTTAAKAEALMGLDARQAAALERSFRAHALGRDEQTPRFARHAAHVRATMAEGGFPAFVERRGRDGRMQLTSTLAWPAPAAKGKSHG